MLNISQMLCIIFGHNWQMYFRYNRSADFKCSRCGGLKKSFGFPSKWGKARYINQKN